MKVIALQASPRVGGNCDVLMDEMIKGIEENGGEVEKYYLERCDIAPCKACMHCAENPECVRADDGNKRRTSRNRCRRAKGQIEGSLRIRFKILNLIHYFF